MKGFLLGVITTIILGVAIVWEYVSLGMAPAATSAPPMLIEKSLARMALHARVNHEMPHQVPIQPTEANYLAGARIYQEHCAVCHGLPGNEKNAIALGEFPKPPHLLRGKGVTDDEPGETYWKVANGIRLTGMPGFSKFLSTVQMWQVYVLMDDGDKSTPSGTALLTAPTHLQPAHPQQA